MITRIEATNARGLMLALSLTDDFNGFRVRDIQGLGPVQGELASMAYAGRHGSRPQGARRGIRNIVITLDLVPDWGAMQTVASLRDQLYTYFMPTTIVDMKYFKDNSYFASNTVTVESCEPDIFTADPSMVISLVAYDPDFLGNPVVWSGQTSNSGTNNVQEVNYQGSVPTGMVMQATFPSNATSAVFSLRNSLYGTSGRFLQVSELIYAADILKLGTEDGNKYVAATRAGSQVSYLHAMTAASIFPQLQPGWNTARFYVNGQAVFNYTLTYAPRYGGI